MGKLAHWVDLPLVNNRICSLVQHRICPLVGNMDILTTYEIDSVMTDTLPMDEMLKWRLGWMRSRIRFELVACIYSE